MNQRKKRVSVRRRFASGLLVAAGLVGIFPVAPALGAESWSGAATLGIQIRGSGGPVMGAMVEIRYLRPGGNVGPEARRTDSNGQANFAGIARGRWSLEISHPDYLVFVASLNVDDGKKPEVVTQFLEASGAGRGTFKVKFLKSDRPLGEVIPGTATEAIRTDRSQPPGSTMPGLSKPEPTASEKAPPPAPKPLPRPEPIEPEAAVPAPTAPAPVPERSPREGEAPESVEPEAASTEPAAQPPRPEVDLETPAPSPKPMETAGEVAVPPPHPIPTEESRVEPSAPAEVAQKPSGEPAGVASFEEPPATPPRTEPASPDPVPSAPVPAPAPAPAPVITQAPVRPPTPLPAATAAPIEETPNALTSFGDRTCFECKPGEWAVAAETAVPAGEPCRPTAEVAIRRAMQDVLASAGEELGVFSGPMPLGLEDFPLSRASTAARNTLAPYLESAASCQFVAVVIPRDGRFTGFRFAARDDRAQGDCTGDQECEIGRARFLFSPGIARSEGAAIVYSVFENTGDASRSARMTGFFLPPAGWTAP